MYVIGIDPGPITGVVWLKLAINRPGANLVAEGAQLVKAHAMQITPDMLIGVLDAVRLTMFEPDAVAYERFVVGRRAGRSSTAAAGATTRDTVGALQAWAREHGPVYARSAADVKPWATDTRLAAAGLLDITKGMRHAKDGARHALYCAVKDYGLPDPLSRRGRSA